MMFFAFIYMVQGSVALSVEFRMIICVCIYPPQYVLYVGGYVILGECAICELVCDTWLMYYMWAGM